MILAGGIAGGDDSAHSASWNSTARAWEIVDSEVNYVVPPAHYTTVVADPSRGTAYSFAGTSLNYDDWYQDLVRWDGVRWRRLASRVSPGDRSWAALGVTPDGNDVLLFGGIPSPYETSEDGMRDTWRWSNGTWSPVASAQIPPGQRDTKLAHDSKQFIMLTRSPFGGSTTWRLAPLGGPCTSRADCGGDACVDNVCCNVESCGTCETCAGTSPGRCNAVLNESDPDTCSMAEGKSCSRLGDCMAALGQPNDGAPELCASGIVADGVCCNTPCDGPCVACRDDLKVSGTLSGICDTATALVGESCMSASCDGDHTVKNPDGSTVDCGAYRCEGSACKSRCTTVADCVTPAICDFEGRCVNSGEQPADPQGCRMTRSVRLGGWSFVECAGTAILVGALVRRRVRRNVVSRAP